MEGYDETTYGAAFADVYDEWYQGVSDVGATVSTLVDLAGSTAGDRTARILELGVGTGRLAIPLAVALAGDAGGDGEPGAEVVGVDASAEMLRLLAERDTAGLVDRVLGDMVTGLPDGPFDLAFVAYNTLFNLTGRGEQQRCIEAVAARLVPGGRFVVEALVPDEPFRDGDDIRLRSMAADRVVLSITRQTAADQRAEGQFVELSESGGVRLRPWSIRYSTPDQIDAMAGAAGLRLEHRWLDMARRAFSDDADRHVSVYRRP